MNWTAILALLDVMLLIVTALLAMLARYAITEMTSARRATNDAIRRAEYAETMKHQANELAGENRREADHWKKLHDTLLARRSRRSDRAQGNPRPETAHEADA